MKLNAKELRVSEPTEEQLSKIKRKQIFIILDNILDTYNIGSIFRLADAVAARKVYLCGKTETPPYHRISKAAVGTEKWVPWEHVKSAEEAIMRVRELESKRVKVIAVEQAEGSCDFRGADLREPVAFVVGHETEGVSKEVLELCDEVVEIPMFGVNRSLNVMVSLAMILSKII
ncbi:MAG: TrmH family RNA methyltransferase [Candidatus Levybacteria bacterium]|nr:TrmH family RNA methyltransferase [Candidatus Levybacteria bacterium]